MKYQVIGTRPIRHDGVDKVTGRALYGADFTMSGLLHGRVLRSPGDRIAELGEGAIKMHDLSSNCLARGKVLYKGQAVAAVAATNPHVAEEALKLIEVDYEV